VKVYVYPADVEGCGHYRMIWPAKVLQARGHDVALMMPGERNDFSARTNQETGEVLDVNTPEDADVMVFQRVTHRFLARALPAIRRKGIAVVVEIDDDLHAIHPGHRASKFLDPRNNVEHNWDNLLLACQNASLVITSAKSLEHVYGTHGRVITIPNYVPSPFLELQHVDNNVIGWGGLVASHPGDLDVMGSSIERLRKMGRKFKVIGNPADVQEALNLSKPVEGTGPVPIFKWIPTLGTLGVGVAPLGDTRFNAAKSWLKPLEYAAAGVPVVMSPRAEYRKINELGVGVLARRPKEWYEILRELSGSAHARRELAQRGRAAARKLTIEEHAWRWWDAWTAALEIERSGLATTTSR
jgi:hypothetical protein